MLQNDNTICIYLRATILFPFPWVCRKLYSCDKYFLLHEFDYHWFSKFIWKYNCVHYILFVVDYWIRQSAGGILTVLVWMKLLLYSPQAHFQDPFWSSANKSELFIYQLVSQGSLPTAAATVWLCQLIHQLIFWLVSWQLPTFSDW